MLGRKLDDRTAMNQCSWLRQHNQAPIRGACKRGDAALNLLRIIHANRTHFHPDRRCRALDGAKLANPSRVCRVSKYYHPRYVGGDLFEQFQPFDAQTKLVRGKAGDVTARMRQAVDDTLANWMGDQ